MYLISVIIPVYNAEKYLEKTIQSVINQSLPFENIQLILVDDNSNDESKKIIEKYSEKYENITTFYSTKNHGYPGYGRNMGINMAKGKYIMFLDNDDEYDVNMCEILYQTIETENADVACCNKISVESNIEKKYKPKYVATEEYDDKVIIKNDDIFFYEEQLIWNKIYKKDIIIKNNIKLLENNYADDFAFVIDYLINSKTLVYLKNYFGYFWNIRSESLSHDVKKEYIEELIEAYKYVYCKLNKENKTYLINNIMKNHINHLIMQTSYLNLNTKEFMNILKKIYDFEHETNISIKLENKIFNFINILILKKHFKIAIYYIKTLNKIRKLN